MRSIRSKLVTAAAAVGAAALGGGTIANAATSPTASSSSSSSASHAHTVNGKTERPLSRDAASKVRAAALAKVPGTVERVETNVDSSAA